MDHSFALAVLEKIQRAEPLQPTDVQRSFGPGRTTRSSPRRPWLALWLFLAAVLVLLAR